MPGAFRKGGFNDGYTITAWDSMAQSNTDGRVLLSPEPNLAVAETVNEPDFVQATPLQETATHANSSPPEGPMDTEDPNGAVTYEKKKHWKFCECRSLLLVVICALLIAGIATDLAVPLTRQEIPTVIFGNDTEESKRNETVSSSPTLEPTMATDANICFAITGSNKNSYRIANNCAVYSSSN
jgi:hypothetical protein